MTRRLFTLLIPAVLATGLTQTPAKAQQAPGTFLRTICLKVPAAATREFEKTRESLTKMNQYRIKQGKLLRFVMAVNAMPGEQSSCDYLAAYVYKGAPPEASMDNSTADMAAAGAGSYEAYLAKASSLGVKRVNTELYSALAIIGDVKQGNYFAMNQMKVHNFADWNKLESEVWKPVMEARVAAGNLTGWRSYVRSIPSGTGHPYNAVTVDAFANWDAMFKPSGLADAMKKVHPNMSTQEFNERTNKARDIVNREVYKVQVALQ